MEAWLDQKISKLSSYKTSPYIRGESKSIDRELARLHAKKRQIEER